MKTIAFLICAMFFLVVGCGGKDFMVRKDKNPVIMETEEPMVTIEKKDALVVFVHRFPAREEPYKKLRLSRDYTFYAAQERIAKEGGEWKAFVNNERVILRNYGTVNGQRRLYGPGYLEPGHFFICKILNENREGNKIYQARFIGQCGNEIPANDLLVLETPVVITKKITATKSMVYHDIDYKPALWAGLAGLLTGLGMGYLFWFGSGSSTTIAASSGSAAGAPCPSGLPTPR